MNSNVKRSTYSGHRCKYPSWFGTIAKACSTNDEMCEWYGAFWGGCWVLERSPCWPVSWVPWVWPYHFPDSSDSSEPHPWRMNVFGSSLRSSIHPGYLWVIDLCSRSGRANFRTRRAKWLPVPLSAYQWYAICLDASIQRSPFTRRLAKHWRMMSWFNWDTDKVLLAFLRYALIPSRTEDQPLHSNCITFCDTDSTTSTSSSQASHCSVLSIGSKSSSHSSSLDLYPAGLSSSNSVSSLPSNKVLCSLPGCRLESKHAEPKSAAIFSQIVKLSWTPLKLMLYFDLWALHSTYFHSST